jgi:hypothetical protein
MERIDITAEVLHSEFDYSDGHLFWKRSKGPVKKGCQAGRKVKDGYVQTCVNRVRLLNHQIIFMMFHGYIPKEIDHINRNVSDNRIENLQATTRSANLRNRKTWTWGK